MFEVCGVSKDKIRCVSSSIDKLDKVSYNLIVNKNSFNKWFKIKNIKRLNGQKLEKN